MSELFQDIATQLGATLVKEEYCYFIKGNDYLLKISGVSKKCKHNTFVECDPDSQIKLQIEASVPRTLLNYLVEGYASIFISSDRSVTSICNSITQRLMSDAIARYSSYIERQNEETLFIQQFDMLHTKLLNIKNASCERAVNYSLTMTFNDNNERFSFIAETYYLSFSIQIIMEKLVPLSILADICPLLIPVSIEPSHNQPVTHGFKYRAFTSFDAAHQLLDCLLTQTKCTEAKTSTLLMQE